MIDAHTFRAAMGQAVTGVYLVTTDGRAGRFGMTVSSLTSITLDPATVMVSIRNRSAVLPALLENGRFAVNVLGAHHDEVSDVFAGRPRSGERFDFNCAEFRAGDNGCPILGDAPVAFECGVWRIEEIHDHTLIFGSVEACYDASPRAPLTYYQGRYGSPQPLRAA